jgi:hypothetical protein
MVLGVCKEEFPEAVGTGHLVGTHPESINNLLQRPGGTHYPGIDTGCHVCFRYSLHKVVGRTLISFTKQSKKDRCMVGTGLVLQQELPWLYE